MNDME